MQEALGFLSIAFKSRSIRSTEINLNSSRSHVIFNMILLKKLISGTDIKIAKLKFIDLAGSEKISKEPFKYINKEHANELIKINQSLSTLGQCIQSLYNKYNFIPYRNSKLTRIIGDSLNGLNDINIIICISPSKSCMNESISTMKFAQRAKN